MPITVVMTGMPAECMPTARPSMMTVAGPIVACLAMPLVGLVLVGGVVLGGVADDHAATRPAIDGAEDAPVMMPS